MNIIFKSKGKRYEDAVASEKAKQIAENIKIVESAFQFGDVNKIDLDYALPVIDEAISNINSKSLAIVFNKHQLAAVRNQVFISPNMVNYIPQNTNEKLYGHEAYLIVPMGYKENVAEIEFF